jgi:sec-independent protein translocase protein TatA
MTLANLLGAFEGPELLIILLIVVLLFGGTKLPGLARSLGQAKREFHDATTSAPPTEPQSMEPSTDTVSISRAELHQLRAAAEHRPTATDASGHTN